MAFAPASRSQQLHALEPGRRALNRARPSIPPYICVARDGPTPPVPAPACQSACCWSGPAIVRRLRALPSAPCTWGCRMAALGLARPTLSWPPTPLRRGACLGQRQPEPIILPGAPSAPAKVPRDWPDRLILISGCQLLEIRSPTSSRTPTLTCLCTAPALHHAALRMLELGRGSPPRPTSPGAGEAARRQALASQELYRLPLRMIVSRAAARRRAPARPPRPGLRPQLRSDGADLSLL
ncbi:hypothetical protein ACPA9J_34720 [Pseudomonas aeruginosa]